MAYRPAFGCSPEVDHEATVEHLETMSWRNPWVSSCLMT
jgi:hypothetical protein